MIDKPGPELNKKIHERLFGHDLTGFEWPKHPTGKSMVKHSAGMVRWEDIPEYSTTWNGMQLVVEEMDKRGWDFTLTYSNGIATAQFGSAAHSQRDSAPFATAMAALKALEDSQNE